MAFERIELGSTEDEVAPIGIGGGWGARARVFDAALERGLNYFFWSPTIPTYTPMRLWLKNKFKTDRDKIILATASYIWRIPGGLERSINRQLKWLGTDYINYFHLGGLKKNDRAALEKVLEYVEKGAIKHAAFSTHDRKLAAELVKDWPTEVAMIRYNAAHRGAETEFFPHVDNEKTAVVSFNSTRQKSLLKAPKGWPSDKPVPRAGDCFRFSLSHPKVDLCLVGATKTEHIDEIVEAIDKGPMSEEELQWMRDFGDMVYGRNAVKS